MSIFWTGFLTGILAALVAWSVAIRIGGWLLTHDGDWIADPQTLEANRWSSTQKQTD